MSVDYASLLSEYDNKGVCGLSEEFDPPDKLTEKISLLCEMLSSKKHVVVHTGAGVSTAAGIPDFRGPKGVWTLEKQGKKVETDVTFGDARPTLTHMALVELVRAGVVNYVISQNVDGLHLMSGLPRNQLSELHGNMFMEKCEKCGREYVRENVVGTVGLKRTGNQCSGGGSRGRCRGKLRDTVLDWEDQLPTVDLERADHHSRKADLSLCLGTTLQIVPAGKLPLLAKKNGGKLVICNLQPTRYDKQADLVIHGYVDDIMSEVMKRLNIPIPEDETQSTCSPVGKTRTCSTVRKTLTCTADSKTPTRSVVSKTQIFSEVSETQTCNSVHNTPGLLTDTCSNTSAE